MSAPIRSLLLALSASCDACEVGLAVTGICSEAPGRPLPLVAHDARSAARALVRPSERRAGVDLALPIGEDDRLGGVVWALGVRALDCAEDVPPRLRHLAAAIGQVVQREHELDRLELASGTLDRSGDGADRVRGQRRQSEATADTLSAEHRLRLVIGAAGLGTWELDLLGASASLDGHLFAMLGYERSDAAVTVPALLDLVHADDRLAALAQLEDHVAGRSSEFRAELRMRAADGGWRWVLVVGEVVARGPDGSASRLAGVSLDVDSERKHQHRLAEVLSALDHASDGVMVFDAETLAFTYVNSGISSMLGYSREQLLRMTPLDLVDDFTPAELRAMIQPLCSTGGGPLQYRARHRHSAGHSVPVEVTLKHVRGGGDGGSCVAILRDNSDQLSYESMLERSRIAAEAANRAKSTFLASMSHELRTPLTAILGFVDLIDDPSLDEAERSAHAETIRRNGEHLLGIISDILDLSKIEAGGLRVEQVDVELAPLVGDMIGLMSVRAEAQGLWLRLEAGSALPPVIRSDPGRIRQILVNLLGNAIKFTREGGVTLRIASSELDTRVLRFEVIDTGIGIEPGKLGQIFESFGQAEDSTGRRFGGWGLGLPISRRLAELLGGSIGVSSTPGAGSTFTASIRAPGTGGGTVDPVRFVRAATADSWQRRRTADRRAAAHPLSGRRVLLAEDGVDNRRLLSHLLSRAGAEVETVENGQEALDRVLGGEAPAPELILMDMQMPVLDGYEASARLRAAGCLIPLIAITAHAMDGDRERCLGAGCDDYITKPVDAARLIETVAAWAGGTLESEARRAGRTAA